MAWFVFMLRFNRLGELIMYDLSWRAICRNAIIEGIKALVRRKICGALLQFGNALSGHPKRQTKGPRGRFPSATIIALIQPKWLQKRPKMPLAVQSYARSRAIGA